MVVAILRQQVATRTDWITDIDNLPTQTGHRWLLFIGLGSAYCFALALNVFCFFSIET
jgi:hypothetical protein